jgi:SpoVK/Ycf46/Vps4 family AAA+-type ATPase
MAWAIAGLRYSLWGQQIDQISWIRPYFDLDGEKQSPHPPHGLNTKTFWKRFDRMLYLGVSTTHEAQLNILEALTRKFRLDASLDLKQVAECCPFNYTGADLYALCSDAMLQAMTRKAEELEETIGV